MYEDVSSFKSKKNNEKIKKTNMLYKLFISVVTKTLLVIVLFLASLIYIKKSDVNKEKFQNVIYKNSLSFAKIYSVYKDYLGDVIPFKNIFKDNTKIVSAEKITYKKIEKNGDGYILSVSGEYVVSSITSGIVVEVKEDEKYLKIIKIQDKNGLNISYGYINELNVKLYDYIEKGELLGNCNNNLYLIFEKDGKYLSYEEYL